MSVTPSDMVPVSCTESRLHRAITDQGDGLLIMHRTYVPAEGGELVVWTHPGAHLEKIVIDYLITEEEYRAQAE